MSQDGPKAATSVSGSLRQSWQPSDTPPPTAPVEADMLDIPIILDLPAGFLRRWAQQNCEAAAQWERGANSSQPPSGPGHSRVSASRVAVWRLRAAAERL